MFDSINPVKGDIQLEESFHLKLFIKNTFLKTLHASSSLNIGRAFSQY